MNEEIKSKTRELMNTILVLLTDTGERQASYSEKHNCLVFYIPEVSRYPLATLRLDLTSMNLVLARVLNRDLDAKPTSLISIEMRGGDVLFDNPEEVLTPRWAEQMVALANDLLCATTAAWTRRLHREIDAALGED